MGITQGNMVQRIQMQKPPTIRVSEVVRTDITWQGRLNEHVTCACQRLLKWTTEEWGVRQTLPQHQGHLWTTLDWLTANCNPHQPSALMRWLRKHLGEGCQEPAGHPVSYKDGR